MDHAVAGLDVGRPRPWRHPRRRRRRPSRRAAVRPARSSRLSPSRSIRSADGVGPGHDVQGQDRGQRRVVLDHRDVRREGRVASNASFTGANTVNGPPSRSVGTSPAFTTSWVRLLTAAVPAAIWAMLSSVGVTLRAGCPSAGPPPPRVARRWCRSLVAGRRLGRARLVRTRRLGVVAAARRHQCEGKNHRCEQVPGPHVRPPRRRRDPMPHGRPRRATIPNFGRSFSHRRSAALGHKVTHPQ